MDKTQQVWRSFRSVPLWVQMILAVNSISLFFDAIDSWKWVQGDKSIPGVPES